ncbi:MAG: GAD domain-containing protein, partial [Methanobacteriota archaeon]
EICDVLQKRVNKKDFDHIIHHDLLTVFKMSTSNLIQKQLRSNGCVKGIVLPGYHGLLKQEQTRLGRELAVYARILTGIGGIIHSDELPAYGIMGKDVQQVKTVLKMKETDAFVLALGQEKQVTAVLDAVVERAQMFLDGVPEEVRRSLPDDTTEYMRPLPGAARMYPETDVPPFRVTKEYLKRITQHLPERPEMKHQRFIQEYHLNEEQTRQLLASGYEQDFENLVKQFPNQTNIILRTLLNTFPEIENQGLPIGDLQFTTLVSVFHGLERGLYAKEAIPAILDYILRHPDATIDQALTTCGLHISDQQEVLIIIKKILKEREAFVKQKGKDALGPLMGVVMKELRGKADGKLISILLEEEIRKIIS